MRTKAQTSSTAYKRIENVELTRTRRRVVPILEGKESKEKGRKNTR